MGGHKRISLLGAIFLLAVMATSGIAIGILYETAFSEEQARLVESAQSQARLMEAVARFDAQFSQHDHPKGAAAATISQIKDAHENFKGFGETGEFLLARRQGDEIVFILKHRHQVVDEPKPVPFDSDLAEPMRRALLGQSGTMVGLDYRGETVLAAYEPVAVLDLGIVAKIDLAEIHTPFIKAGVLVFAIALATVIVGIMLFFLVGNPLVEQMETSELRLRGAIESLQEGFLLFDADDRLVAVNNVYRRINPKAQEYLEKGRTFEDLVRATVERGWFQAKGREDEFIRERLEQHRNPKGPIIRQFGNGKWYILKETRTPDGGIAITLTDITELKQAEETLANKTRLMELLQRVAVSANEAGSVDEAMKTCLEEVCAHTGWPVGHVYMLADDGTGELASTKIWHLDRPEDFKAFRRVTEKTRFAPGVGLPGRVLTSGLPTWIVDVTKDPNFPRAKLAKDIGVKGGFAFPVLVGREAVAVLEFFAAEAVEPDRAILEVMGPIGTQLGRVVERTQAEVALRESERRFRDIAEAASDWFWEMDENLRFTYYSPRYFEITGFRPEDKIGTTRTRYVDPSDLERDADKWDQHFADLEAHKPYRNFEFSIKVPDGSVLHIRNSGTPVFDPDGAFLGYRGTGTDVTGQKHVESQLQQAQKMEAVGNLTGGIAHDFNNILGVILGNMQLLKRRLKDEDRFRSLIEAAIDATQRGADLTRRLLAFSRRQELDPRVLNMNELVAGMDKMLRRALGEQVEIETTLPDGLGHVKADPAQLESALLNLAINARDAMAGGGRLMIETSNAELDNGYIAMHPYAKAGPHVCLSVADTGPGIPEEIRERIFEPFFTTKEVGKGSGLGLSMIYGFVKQSGGHINVYSEDGHGTRFRIYLPRTDEPSIPLKAGEAADDLPRGTETVLLVEDDEQFRRTAALLLEDLGYTVLGQPDGPSALESLEAHPEVDVLFTDMIMPGGLNGHELAERAQELRSGLPVLLTSGYPRDAFSEGRRFPLLSKPYTDVSLAQTLRAVLDGRHKPEE